MTTRLSNLLHYSGIKTLRDLEACEERRIKRLSNCGKKTFKELCKLMEAENIRFLDPKDYWAPRVAVFNHQTDAFGTFVFYVRLSTMDEEPSYIQEGKTLIEA